MVLLQGPTRWRFLMSEVPLYPAVWLAGGFTTAGCEDRRGVSKNKRKPKTLEPFKVRAIF